MKPWPLNPAASQSAVVLGDGADHRLVVGRDVVEALDDDG